MLTDADGRLTGLFTDSDLARLFERRDEAALDRPIAEVMVASPTTVPSGTRMRRRGQSAGDAEVQRTAGGRPQPAGRSAWST